MKRNLILVALTTFALLAQKPILAKKKSSDCPSTVALNFTPIVFAGQNPDFSTFDQPWLGWWVVDANGLWTPARNVKIHDHQKVAIHLGATGGGLTRFGPFLQSLGNYDVVLGIRYNTTKPIQNVTGNFVTDRLREILKLQNVAIDLFPFSMGAVALRWALEENELGKYEQIKHVVLIGDPAQGILAPDMFATHEKAALAVAISNAIEATTDIDALGLSTTNSPTTTIADASNNVTLPTSIINVASTVGLPGSGTALVTTTSGVQIVSYTGTTATSFTGVTGGTGTMLTGNVVTIPVFKDAVLTLLQTQYAQLKGNAQLDSKLPGPLAGGEVTKTINNHTVSAKTFCNLTYYTVNGFDFNMFPISFLNQLYHLGENGHPYSFIGQYIFGITDPATIELLESWDITFANVGALANFAALQLNTVPQIVAFDGFIPARNDVLTEKSLFFRDNRYTAEIFVPENYIGLASSTQGAPLSHYMQELYTNLINSFAY